MVAPLGAGGMGEVWKARDTRLDRFVAVKVLPEHLAQHPESLARFEREAKAVAALNHPNITGIFDLGRVDDTAYAVMELLEGESLRTRLEQGPLPARKATELAIQLAQGLAAAHEKGVIHRDLKPDNLWLTKERRLKILDFGLAKQLPAMGIHSDSFVPTAALSPGLYTEQGMILGTMGYMSPEQVRGEAVDARADLFAFGVVLFEMLTGKRAFARATPSDTMAAILRDEPAEPEGSGKPMPLALRRIIDHCLEKEPGRRFQDARDVAFALESLSSPEAAAPPILPPAVAPGHRRTPWLWGALALLVLLPILFGTWRLGRNAQGSATSGVSYQQRTFRPQAIFRAAFMPDGATIVYSAALSGSKPELFLIRPEYPEPQPLGLADTHLLAISSKGELAVLMGARFLNHRLFTGTLARVTLGGTAPRELLEGVREADWSPDGTELAIIRTVAGKDRLEYPIGKVRLETTGYLSDLRVSPQGDRIALFEHPQRFDDRGSVIVVDLAGRRTLLAEGFEAEEGLAWSPTGDEVFFSATPSGANVSLYGVDRSGHRRVALVSAGGLTLQDVAHNGRWLVTRDDKGWGISVLGPGASAERDLSWLDSSSGPLLSPDGRTMVFRDYSSLAAGSNYLVCRRKTDGGPVVHLGSGDAQGLSPDGKWALAAFYTPPSVMLYPTGPGEARRLPAGLEAVQAASWFPDGKHILMEGNLQGQASRCFQQEISGGALSPVTPEGTTNGKVSPDGLRIYYATLDGASFLQSLAGGPAQPVPGLTPEDQVNLWSADGRALYLTRRADLAFRIEKLDLATGHRQLLRTVVPAPNLGALNIGSISLADEAKVHAYGYLKMNSQLFVVEGAR